LAIGLIVSIDTAALSPARIYAAIAPRARAAGWRGERISADASAVAMHRHETADRPDRPGGRFTGGEPVIPMINAYGTGRLADPLQAGRIVFAALGHLGSGLQPATIG
jgi:hypothetical protein